MGRWQLRQLDIDDIFYKIFYKSRNVLKYSTVYFGCQHLYLQLLIILIIKTFLLKNKKDEHIFHAFILLLYLNKYH